MPHKKSGEEYQYPKRKEQIEHYIDLIRADLAKANASQASKEDFMAQVDAGVLAP